MRRRGASGKLQRIAVIDDGVTVKEILNNEWSNAEIVSVKDTDECVQRLVNENVDGALLMTYTAQKLARDDMQNRLRVEVVPGASMSLRMGVLSEVDRSFYGLWEKTLYNVSRKSRAEIVQSYVEDVGTPTIMAYLFDHPLYLVALIAEVATELLGSLGLVVDWAENGSEAVDQFEASDPGSYFAIFMDMQMPVMEGIEATKKIRNSVREDNDVPIFAMTANTFATDRKRCADAGIFRNR